MASNNDNLLKQLTDPENPMILKKMLSLMRDDVVIEDVPFGMVMKGKEGVKQGFIVSISQIQSSRYSQNLRLLR